jgi:acetyl esterase/lipase
MRTSLLASLAFGLCLIVAAPLAAQTPARGATRPQPVDPWTIRLWDGPAPGAQGTADRDIPTLTVYMPYGRAARTAVVVAPGGGYQNLAMNHEGRQVANWLNGLGITAFVLKYRLGPTYHHPIELGDAQRAIRIVRSRAAEFGVEPDRIGIMGFSAGGHLASTAATHFDAGQPSAADPIDRAGSRPDFLVLAYPVITADEPYRHDGSFKNLLGDHPDPALLDELSNEKQVTADTPPTFLFHTDEDTTVPAENSVRFYLALRAAHVPAELHIFRPGRHGVGLAMSDPTLDAWPPLLAQWLRNGGLLTPPDAAPAARSAATSGAHE